VITTTRSAREPKPTSPRRPSASAFAARVTDEERSRDRRDRRAERDLIAVAREDQRDRAEHRSLPDAVSRRVEEGAERRGLASGSSERTVENVEDRADDEDERAEPIEKELVVVLEVHDNGRCEAQ